MAKVKRKGSQSQLKAAINIGGVNGMIAWGSLVVAKAAEKAPVKSSALALSLGLDTVEQINLFTFSTSVTSTVPYAAAQEFGSGLHGRKGAKYPIVAGAFNPGTNSLNPKKALSFLWPSAPADIPKNAEGKVAFRSVMHPGVKPQPYATPAAEELHVKGAGLFWRSIFEEVKRSAP